MAKEYQLALCTAPDSESAQQLGRALVENRLAACVTLLPGATSIYRWQGVIEQASEVQLLIKTRQTLKPQIEQLLKTEHPYEVPELLFIDISDGSAPYLQWLKEQLPQ